MTYLKKRLNIGMQSALHNNPDMENRISGNAFNPTVQNVINGNCSQ